MQISSSDPLAIFRMQQDKQPSSALNGTGSESPQTFRNVLQQQAADAAKAAPEAAESNNELKDAFSNFVGQTFYSQMLSTLRKSVEKSEYFNGGRGEEVFQGQLDQVLVEKLTEASADNFAGPMFDVFAAQTNRVDPANVQHADLAALQRN
jgi:flagellar protein FlgJ